MEIKELPKSQIELRISVPSAELEKFLSAAAEELSKELKIPGFRPGKVPRNIAEQKIGTEKILAHGAEKAVKKSYADAVTENKIETIGAPEITITKIAPGNDLEYKAVVSVLPKIKLGNYRKAAREIQGSEKKKIKFEDIEKEIEYLRKSRAKLITVSRATQVGDRVEIDFDVLVEGREIEGGKSRNHPLVVGENYFIPGFEDNLVGMKEKEAKEFGLNFPKDYNQKDLAGKPAIFKVKMNIVQEMQLPEINDEFAKNLGNFESLEGLKKNIAKGLEMEQQKKNIEKWRQEVLGKITEGSEIELPDILVENETEKMLAELEQNISSMGMKIEDYLVNIKKTKEELKKDWKNPAEQRVKSALELKEIAALENLSPESHEIEEELNKTLAHFKGQADLEKNVDMEGLYNYVKNVLTNEKVLEFLENLKK